MPAGHPTLNRKRLAFSLTSAAAIAGAACFLWACTERAGTSTQADLSPSPAHSTPAARAEVVTEASVNKNFHEKLQPFLETYCATCHSGADPKAGLDVSKLTSPEAVLSDDRVSFFIAKLKNGSMPPANAPKKPTADQRHEAIAWFQSLNRLEALKDVGDPGVVLGHRLSNSEYNYVIRDLTGVDIQPAKEFPVDAANQAGFDNTGESLNMEPALLTKYMEAARSVAEHMVLKTGGIDFAPYEVTSITDRDKYCVNQIVDFYSRQPTDLRAYFLAAWRYENRNTINRKQATLFDFGNDLGLSEKYLTKVWDTLNDKSEKMGPIAAVQALWRSLPMPDGKTPDAAMDGCGKMVEFVANIRQKTRPSFANLTLRGLDNGGQWFVLWKDRQYEATRMSYLEGTAFDLTPEDLGPGTPAAAVLAAPKDDAGKAQYEAAFKRFAAVFPDVFYVQERARIYLNPNGEKNLTGRLLSAGLHSQTSYFRDDAPLYQLILDEKGQKELDTLWRDFAMVTDWPVRMYQSGIWFERSDSSLFKARQFDFVRTEEHEIVEEPVFSKTRDLVLENIKGRTEDATVIKAFGEYYDIMGKMFRELDKDREAAVPIHLAALQDFAQRAYRRPLTQAEKDDITGFYKSLRKDDGLDHEEAMRDSLVSVLMSPYFTYRVSQPAKTTARAEPLTDSELANRLSFFLWSSIPDKELLAHVAAGDLHKPEVIKAQAHRLMKDPRIVALSTEFGGNWLDFRRFEEHNGVDRERFKTFDNNLRESMFQEPIRFITDVVQNDRSVLDFIYGDYTFVDKDLAKHYGMNVGELAPGQWIKVDNARDFQRGGLLPMAVFLTKNSPGLRTSPVKRGYWVVRRVLGEEIPPPPPNVPVLPADESKLGDLTLPQVLAKHRQDPSCAACHTLFDGVGLSFEGFGPIGETRTQDMGGKPVQNKSVFRDGTEGTGVDGLRAYIKASREGDFLDNLCRKLLANALGRTLIISDDLLVEQMMNNLKANGYRFSSLVDTIVTSPQFLNKRGQNALARKDG